MKYALHTAVTDNNSPEFIQLLIDLGAEINLPNEREDVNYNSLIINFKILKIKNRIGSVKDNI